MRALGAPFTYLEREAFIEAARSYVGVRWRHQGRSLRGVDCGGLVFLALRDAGRDPVDSQAYGRSPYRGSLESVLQANFGEPLPKDMLRAGDVPLFRFNNDKPSHVAVVANHPQGGFSMIHAFAQMRKVVEHRIDEEWFGNMVEVYRP